MILNFQGRRKQIQNVNKIPEEQLGLKMTFLITAFSFIDQELFRRYPEAEQDKNLELGIETETISSG